MKNVVNRAFWAKKTKFLYIAALVGLLGLVSCEKNEPFDTQSPDDAPLILKPYNESGTGSFTYDLANPDTPLFDSVTVTPSAYTTVNWYLDGERVFTGTKIEMCFPAGKYNLTIEAVTTANKRTERTGSVTVHPYEADPYSAAPAAARHFVPGSPATINGANLSKVTELIVSRDIFFKDIVCTITEFTGDDASLTFTLPETADGRYFLRLKDAEGKTYGADAINVHNAAVILAGYQEFTPGAAWTITGVKLENVASVIVDGTPITDLTVTSTSITLVAPEAEVGNHTLSVKNADGSNVYFITDAGLVTEVTTIVSAEITFWSGEVNIDWNADLLRVPASQLAEIPAGATIAVYYTVPAAEYHALRITNPAWSSDFLPQVDGMAEQPNPYTFEFTENSKALIDGGQDFCVVGFGLTITKITYK